MSLLGTFCFGEVELKSYIGYEHKSYLKTEDENSRDNNNALTFQSEIKYNLEDGKIYSLVDAIKDSSENERDHFHITELYYSKSFDTFDLDIGKKVIFLGSLEAYNIVNIFNRQNYQKDSLSTYKKGAFMVNVNYFFEDDSILNLYVKSFEEDIEFSSSESPYYPFGSSSYDESVKFANSSEKPSILGVYSMTYDEDIIADTSFGLFYGYDENILFSSDNGTINPYLFQSMKLFTYDTFVIDSTLYKVEASYTKVQSDGDFEVDDFYQLGTGVEYTIEQIYQNHNLGFIAEYYKSNKDDLSYENDVFLGLRYSLNDQDSSEFLGGTIKDVKTSDNIAYIRYSGRLTDSLNVSSDIRYTNTQSYLGEHLRFDCEVKYYF